MTGNPAPFILGPDFFWAIKIMQPALPGIIPAGITDRYQGGCQSIERQTIMGSKIVARPLTSEAFAEFGEVIETKGAQQISINNGQCTRFHDLATIQFSGPDARPLVNIFSSSPCALPLELKMVERHPLGSQAFIPFSRDPFLVIVARDRQGTPETPEVFITSSGQGVNIRQNTWHGVLSPLYKSADFLVIDRGGEGDNLEEYFYPEPSVVTV